MTQGYPSSPAALPQLQSHISDTPLKGNNSSFQPRIRARCAAWLAESQGILQGPVFGMESSKARFHFLKQILFP